VAASVLATVFWMIRNPRQGFNLPDHLPHDEILEVAQPYLGPMVSQAVDWSPRDYRDTVAGQAARPGDPPRDIWQFSNFLVTPMTRRSRPRAAQTPARRKAR
jgi:homospermidine synthase